MLKEDEYDRTNCFEAGIWMSSCRKAQLFWGTEFVRSHMILRI